MTRHRLSFLFKRQNDNDYYYGNNTDINKDFSHIGKKQFRFQELGIGMPRLL